MTARISLCKTLPFIATMRFKPHITQTLTQCVWLHPRKLSNTDTTLLLFNVPCDRCHRHTRTFLPCDPTNRIFTHLAKLCLSLRPTTTPTNQNRHAPDIGKCFCPALTTVSPKTTSSISQQQPFGNHLDILSGKSRVKSSSSSSSNTLNSSLATTPPPPKLSILLSINRLTLPCIVQPTAPTAQDGKT